MRVALISDLHGNEVALEAVLAAIALEGVDQTVCLGDVATLGPRPKAVIQRLRDLGCPCVKGNHDAFLLDAELIHKYTDAPLVVQSVDWCRMQLSSQELEFLQGMSAGWQLDLGAGNSLAVYHGSPRSPTEDLLATTPADQVEAALGSARATVMAGGHTHLQMLRQHRGTLLVNPGSVGMPFKEYVAGRTPTLLPHAEYGIVQADRTGVRVTLCRVPIDLDAFKQTVRDSQVPLRSMLLTQYEE
jgi:predicted phosphodiesterase